jgi:hypothetical protein
MLNKTPLQVNHVLIFDYKKFLFRGLGSTQPMPLGFDLANNERTCP